MENDCVFCKIISGALPSYKLYEDQDAVVILDRFPAAAGHALIVSKAHREDIFDLEPELCAGLFALARRTAAALRENTGCDGINIFQNNGKAAGQQIPHFHIHAVHRFKADPVLFHYKTLDPAKEEFEDFIDTFNWPD